MNLIFFWIAWSVVISRDSKSLACLQVYSTPSACLLSLMGLSREKRVCLQVWVSKSNKWQTDVPGSQHRADQHLLIKPWFQILFSPRVAPGTDNNPVHELCSTQGAKKVKGWQLRASGGCLSLQTHWVLRNKWCNSKNVCYTGNQSELS